MVQVGKIRVVSVRWDALSVAGECGRLERVDDILHLLSLLNTHKLRHTMRMHGHEARQAFSTKKVVLSRV